ncbi:MAG: AAA family ATPase [Tepidisphaeraceae bacterium]
MRIIALMNQKGGVGKTTTTANLGAALAELGKRVCLIDLDPQSHLTINYGVDPNAPHIGLYDCLIDGRSFLEAVHIVDTNVALVPSSIDLAGAEIELVNVPGRETLLKKKIEDAQHDFDFILIDCPPSLGLLTLNALSVAGEVIIPMQPHFLALQGVAKILETVQLVSQRINSKLKVSGIVLTMFDAQTKLSSEVVAELNGFIAAAQGKPLPWADARVFSTKIRRNIKLAESPSFGQTILKYDSASHGAFDYRNLARELVGVAPLAAPVARPVVKAPVMKAPVVRAPVIVTTKPVAPGALPPKPVMPPALVAAMKARPQAIAAPAPVPAPKMAVAVNPKVDPTRLAASSVTLQAIPAASSAPIAKPSQQEVA